MVTTAAYLPAAQSAQKVAAVAENLPAAQSTHVADTVAPVAVEYFPEPQSAQVFHVVPAPPSWQPSYSSVTSDCDSSLLKTENSSTLPLNLVPSGLKMRSLSTFANCGTGYAEPP